MVHTITYRSEERDPLTPAEVMKLTSQSSRKNEENDITGFMIYLYGVFIQVLEGPKEKVESLFAIINQDPRHKNVTVLHRGSKFFRDFGEWGMNCGFPASSGPASSGPSTSGPSTSGPSTSGGANHVVARARFQARTKDPRYVAALLKKAYGDTRAKADAKRRAAGDQRPAA